MNEVAF